MLLSALGARLNSRGFLAQHFLAHSIGFSGVLYGLEMANSYRQAEAADGAWAPARPDWLKQALWWLRSSGLKYLPRVNIVLTQMLAPEANLLGHMLVAPGQACCLHYRSQASKPSWTGCGSARRRAVQHRSGVAACVSACATASSSSFSHSRPHWHWAASFMRSTSGGACGTNKSRPWQQQQQQGGDRRIPHRDGGEDSLSKLTS